LQFYWAVDEALVVVVAWLSFAAGGVLDAALSFAGAMTFTTRLAEPMRPF
jgi:hypothetical protein